MPTLTQNKFQGIAPNVTSFDGQAAVAQNVDLSGGGLKPVKAPSFESSGHTQEIVYHNDSWVSGATNYLSTDIRGIPALIFNRDGKWKINVNDVAEQDLWLGKPTGVSVESSLFTNPPAPVVTNVGAGNIIPDVYDYFVSFVEVDNQGNEVRESILSAPATITVTEGQVKVARPSTSGVPAGTKWRVWRRAEGATYARVVEEQDIINAFTYDDKDATGLGASKVPETDTTDRIDYRYTFVWVRSFGGWEHESIPSDLVAITQKAHGVTVKLTEPAPSGVTGWRIYRISLSAFDPTTTFQLVADLPLTTTEYLDSLENVELGGALASSYRSDNGALVSAGIPSEDFEGMAGPFNGFYVGWVGRDLYLSEPGNPAWWPGSFVSEANFPIKSVTQTGGNLAVVTTGGCQMGYGVSPDAFTLSQSIFGNGGQYRTATAKNFYLGYEGIYEVQQESATLVSTGFDREYFEDMINPWMIQEKERLFLFHDQGALVYDFKTRQWTTLSYVFSAVHESGGEVYGLNADGIIVKLFGSDDDESFTYEGTASFNDAGTKRIESLKFTGTGSCTVSLSQIEDLDLKDTTGVVELETTDESDKMVYPPAWLHTEAIRYKVSGKATVRAIMFEVEQGNTER